MLHDVYLRVTSMVMTTQVRKISLLLWTVLLVLSSCQEAKLPYLGAETVQGDSTVYPKVGPFELLDQDSMQVSTATVKNKIHIASFIFLSCPTICPQMNVQMKQLQEETMDLDDVVLLSYTIDPKRDTIPALKAYADKIGAKRNKWHFLHGTADEVYRLAEQSYYAIAFPDSTAPGGFSHSGGFLLVDKDLHIRGVYDGTSKQETQKLIQDIHILRKEK